MKRCSAVIAGVAIAVFFGACSSSSGNNDQSRKQQDQISRNAKQHSTYVPKNYVERNNYEKAQKLYDDPTTIIWCTAFPNSPTAPIVTVPVAGKLTSSSTTFFAPEHSETNGDTGMAVLPSRSVDGLYHPNPPQYRYGFTPGGQYVDFFNLGTICTTAPMKFQTRSIKFAIDPSLASADSRATSALKRGDKAGAQKILENAAP